MTEFGFTKAQHLRSRADFERVYDQKCKAADGVLLRIVESGFDAIPETRRADAFEANSGGWAKQAELVRKYLSLGQRV